MSNTNKCETCNGNCLKECQASYGNVNKDGKRQPKYNNINYSLTMNGIESCSHGCVYCSAATTLNYAQGVNKDDLIGSLKKIDEKTYEEFNADFPKLEETLEHNSRFRNALKIQEEGGPQAEVHIDFWGGDPVTCHLATQEMVAFCEDFFINKHHMKLTMSSSTGGLPLARKDICDFYKEHHMTLQISHDGCGQWMRTGDIDPLYDPRIRENIADLFRCGVLNMVNCCLNFYNYSVFANQKYWVDYFKGINMPTELYKKLFIKLNRVYDGDYDVQKKNVHGYFGSEKTVYEELKNKPFGDMRFFNKKHPNTGNIALDHRLEHVLDDYLAEWLQLAIMMRDERVTNDVTWTPFISYISEQVNRWQPMKHRDESTSICRRFQMTMAKVGDPKFWCKPNEFGDIEMFVIDSKGKYCECNLIDSDHHVKNVGCATTPKQCPDCKYYLQSECQGCGSEIFTEDCEFRYRWLDLLKQVKYMDDLIKYHKGQYSKPSYDKGYKEGFEKGKEEERVHIGTQVLRKMGDFFNI